MRRGLRCHDAAVRATYARCEMQRAARQGQGQDMGRAQQNDRLCDALLAGDTKSAWRRVMLVRGARSRVRQLCEKQMVLLLGRVCTRRGSTQPHVVLTLAFKPEAVGRARFGHSMHVTCNCGVVYCFSVAA